MKFSAILLPTLVIALSSLTVNAQDHPKKDSAGVHHEHKDGKKDGVPKDTTHAGKSAKPAGPAKGAKPAGKPHDGKPKEAPAAVKQ